MGACVSTVHGDSTFGSKQDDGDNKNKKQELLIPSSPAKLINKPVTNGIAQWPPISQSQSAASFSDIGSKDEAFFDTQGWLESDCEDDDFKSVRGDFTPSRGNTPVHHNFSAGTTKVNEPLLADLNKPDAVPEPSPNTQKRRLSDLFKDSLRATHDDDDKKEEDKLSNNQNGVNGKLGTPYAASEANYASSNGRRTPSGDLKPIREKSMRSVQWCLPNMLSTRSYSERKKMSPAPAPNVG